MDCVISFDIGGTSIKYGLVDSNGMMIYKSKTPSNASFGAGSLMQTIVYLISEIVTYNKENNIIGIGIASAGQIDSVNGRIIYATPNIPEYTSMNVKNIMESKFGLITCVENDVNAMAIGEIWIGAGKGKKNILCISVGTGIGGSIISNGIVEHGVNGISGEIGHMIIKHNGLACNCGNKGCYEQYASATALVRNYRKIIRGKSYMPGFSFIKDKHQIDSQMIFQLARNGDKLAQNAVDQFISYLGTGLVSLIHILNPELIILGGGVSNEGEYLSDKVYEYVNKHVMPSFMDNLKIITASLGNDAGVIGAAKVVYDQISYKNVKFNA